MPETPQTPRKINNTGEKINSSATRGFGSDLARNAFSNLILLCKEDHGLVDDKVNEARFSVDILRAWKTAVEGAYADDLDELDWLTEEKLQNLMADAITTTRTTLLDAIDKVRDVGTETLQTLKSLVTESFTRPYLDADSIASLEYSANVLERLPDQVDLLHLSSHNLRSLPDSTDSLAMSSLRLQDLEGMVNRLTAAADRLQGIQDFLPWLSDVADKIPNSEQITRLTDGLSGLDGYRLRELNDSLQSTRDSVTMLDESSGTVVRLESAARSVSEAVAAIGAQTSSGEWSWKSFKWGAIIALAAVFALLILFVVGFIHAPIMIKPG